MESTGSRSHDVRRTRPRRIPSTFNFRLQKDNWIGHFKEDMEKNSLELSRQFTQLFSYNSETICDAKVSRGNICNNFSDISESIAKFATISYSAWKIAYDLHYFSQNRSIQFFANFNAV